MAEKSRSVTKISEGKKAQLFKEYDRLSPQERLERFDKNVAKAEKQAQIKKEEIQKNFKAKMKERGEVEKYREKCIRPGPEFKSIHNFCVSLFRFFICYIYVFSVDNFYRNITNNLIPYLKSC
jgi:hypothetical protein